MRIKIIPILFLGVILFIAGCGKKDPVIAAIGNEGKITLSMLNDSFRETPVMLSSDVTFEAVEPHLETMIREQLEAYSAKKLKADTLREVKDQVNSIEERQMLMQLYNMEVIDNLISESEMRELYAKRKKEVEYRKMVFQLKRNASQAQRDSLLKKANSIYDQLLRGVDFAYLARNHSDDSQTAARGGYAGKRRWQDAGAPEYIEWLFENKPGDISRPLFNMNGYVILKIEDVHRMNIQPYRSMREGLKNTIRRHNKQEEERSAQIAYLEKMKAEQGLKWNEDHLILLYERLKSYETSHSEAREIKDKLRSENKEFHNIVIGKHNTCEFTIKDFVESLDNYPDHYPFLMENEQSLIEMFESFRVNKEMLLAEARRRNLDKVSIVKEAVEKEKIKLLAAHFRNHYLYADTEPSETDVRFFYENYKHKHYHNPARVSVQEILVKDKDMAEQIVEWINQGRAFDELARQYTQRGGLANERGLHSFFTVDQWGKMSEEAFKMQEAGEIAGPIYLDADNAYSIIKFLERQPESYNPFEEVRENAYRRARHELREKRMNEWLTEIKKEVPVDIKYHILKREFVNV